MTKRKNKKEPDDVRKDLLKELRGLIKDIPEEGLLFLIGQTNTILYNMRVDELNKTNERINNSKKSSDSTKKTPRKAQEIPHTISIERSSFGRNFILVINDSRKIMSESEITKIVRIAYKAADQKEGAVRLFAWFKANRDDVILDAVLSTRHPDLQELYTYLKKNFSMV